MQRSQGEFRQATLDHGTRESQEEEYFDLIICHILWAGLSRLSPPPDTWARILQRLISSTPLPSSYEEVNNEPIQC